MSIIAKGISGKRKSFSRETGQLETVVRPFSVPSFFVPQEMAALPLRKKEKKEQTFVSEFGWNRGNHLTPKHLLRGVIFLSPI